MGGVILRLLDAAEKLDRVIGIPLGRLFNAAQLEGIRINKGKSGQLLETILGLENTSGHLDFEDGELKTNMATITGAPRETMFITQISSHIDEILGEKPFTETHLFSKIANLLYVPICKEGAVRDWVFLPYVHINYESPDFTAVYHQLERDYYSIVHLLNECLQLNPSCHIHTVSGLYIQIRTKDSGKYHPIHSEKYGRIISDKNRAFYFKKEFMLELQRISEKYPIE